MNEPHAQQPQATAPAPSRGRRVAGAAALVAGGALAGAILAGTLSASAAVTSTDGPGSETTAGCVRGEALDEATLAQVEEAVLAAHPDATVRHARTHPDGGYVAHVVTADDQHLLVRLDDSFAITEEIERAERPGRRGPFDGPGSEGGTTDGSGGATGTAGLTL